MNEQCLLLKDDLWSCGHMVVSLCVLKRVRDSTQPPWCKDLCRDLGEEQVDILGGQKINQRTPLQSYIAPLETRLLA